MIVERPSTGLLLKPSFSPFLRWWACGSVPSRCQEWSDTRSWWRTGGLFHTTYFQRLWSHTQTTQRVSVDEVPRSHPGGGFNLMAKQNVKQPRNQRGGCWRSKGFLSFTSSGYRLTSGATPPCFEHGATSRCHLCSAVVPKLCPVLLNISFLIYGISLAFSLISSWNYGKEKKSIELSF